MDQLERNERNERQEEEERREKEKRDYSLFGCRLPPVVASPQATSTRAPLTDPRDKRPQGRHVLPALARSLLPFVFSYYLVFTDSLAHSFLLLAFVILSLVHYCFYIASYYILLLLLLLLLIAASPCGLLVITSLIPCPKQLIQFIHKPFILKPPFRRSIAISSTAILSTLIVCAAPTIINIRRL